MMRWLIKSLRGRLGHHRLLTLAVQPRWAIDAYFRRLLPRRRLPGPRIAVVSMWDDRFAPIARVTAANKTAYCERHGYAWRPFETRLAPELPPAWSKIPSILRILPDFDWVMWTDADSLVTNPNIRLEPFTATGADLVITADTKGINSGEFLIRRCPWSFAFLQSALAAPDLPAFQAYLGTLGLTLATDGLFEQRAMMWLLSSYREFRHVHIVPQRSMNSYAKGHHANGPSADHAPGDFILHLPGLDQATRLELFARYQNQPQSGKTSVGT
jgi:hypothetical protein